jgi:hypothetical protein
MRELSTERKLARAWVHQALTQVTTAGDNDALFAANQALMAALRRWGSVRLDAEGWAATSSWLGRLRHAAWRRQDNRLDGRVAEVVERRKRGARSGHPKTAGDLPVHDWLRESWR